MKKNAQLTSDQKTSLIFFDDHKCYDDIDLNDITKKDIDPHDIYKEEKGSYKGESNNI